jgi:hypothetical protein
MFFLRKRKRKASVMSSFFLVHHSTVSAVKKVEFISDRKPYIVLKGRWYNIIVLNVHEYVRSKNTFHYEFEQGFDYFSNYLTKTLLGDCNARLGIETIFQQTIGNESLHQDSKYIGV